MAIRMDSELRSSKTGEQKAVKSAYDFINAKAKDRYVAPNGITYTQEEKGWWIAENSRFSYSSDDMKKMDAELRSQLPAAPQVESKGSGGLPYESWLKTSGNEPSQKSSNAITSDTKKLVMISGTGIFADEKVIPDGELTLTLIDDKQITYTVKDKKLYDSEGHLIQTVPDLQKVVSAKINNEDWVRPAMRGPMSMMVVDSSYTETPKAVGWIKDLFRNEQAGTESAEPSSTPSSGASENVQKSTPSAPKLIINDDNMFSGGSRTLKEGDTVTLYKGNSPTVFTVKNNKLVDATGAAISSTETYTGYKINNENTRTVNKVVLK
jgi:hypothetical protein